MPQLCFVFWFGDRVALGLFTSVSKQASRAIVGLERVANKRSACHLTYLVAIAVVICSCCWELCVLLCVPG